MNPSPIFVAATEAPTVAPGAWFIGNEGETSCPSGSEITETKECEAACSELGIGPLARLRNEKPCYKAGNGKCRQDANQGARASLICKHDADTGM